MSTQVLSKNSVTDVFPNLKKITASALFFLLTACAAVGPDYKEPEMAVPDAWTNAVINEVNANKSLEQWWTTFNEPILESLLERAKNANPELLIAVERIDEARAFSRIAGGDRYPDLNATANFDRSKISENLGGGVFADNPSNTWSTGLASSWEIDVFGRVRRTIEAAEADVGVSIEDYRDVMVSLYAQVAINYVNVRTLQQRIKFARSNIKNQTDTLGIVQSRFDAGLVPKFDVAQSKYNLANTETLIPELIPFLEQALNQLAILIGQAPGSLDKELSQKAEIPTPVIDISIAPPAELLRQRPDIRQAERQVAAQSARIGVATADLYPTFSLSGALTLGATDFGDVAESDSVGWSLVPGIRWNLFSGGKVEGLIDVEESRTKQAVIRYEKIVLDALSEVETTMVAVNQERLRAKKLSEAVDASQESVDLVSTSYVAGLTDFQSLLDSQRSLFTQQDRLVESQGLAVINFINLNRALGGGWSLTDPVLINTTNSPATTTK
jgi:outer membrane protein, multidrug efflux system